MKAPITYTIDRSKDFRKSVIIWKENTGCSSPIAYIHKPKHVSEDDFNKFLDSIKIYIKS